MITIYGRIPSKKNSRSAIPMGKRCILIPQKAHAEWHKDASKQLIGQKAIPTPCRLIIEFYYPDKRRVDNNNKAASIMDLLVDNGIIEDDSTEFIPEELYISRGVDKINPRAEITWQTPSKPVS